MRWRTVTLLAAVTIAGWITAERATGVQEAERRWITPPISVAFAGSYSGITTREYHRVIDEESWATLWARHIGENAERDSYGEIVAPVIDFERHMVIAIFNGEAWNTRSMKLVELSKGDEWHVRFDANTYQTAALEPEEIVIEGEATPEKIEDAILRDAQQTDAEREATKHDDPNYTSAYGIFVLPRTTHAVVLIENTQGIIGEPPIWEEKHRFDAVQE